MGRNQRRSRHRDNKDGRRGGRSRDGNSERKPYTMVPKENQSFENFYKAQNIVPEDEWDDFLAALRRPLPSTFRITGFKDQSPELLEMIKSEYFDKLTNIEVEGRTIQPPKCLPWYPKGLAWQLDMDRKFIRHCEPLKKLHNFLVEETESGNISRQEAVSMIPPVVLGVESHHKVLDMCAAPGSKTAQLIESLHCCDTPVPEGCVVANDSDNKRCYLMTHQVKRLESPSFVIVNHDATCMPNLKLPNKEGILKPIKFDRILADVPCSGDGTLRKNVDVWAKWNTHIGMHLHNLQSRILGRGLEMLQVGGRIVYSTCSLNPIEDEAVIATMLRKAQGTVKLVEIASKLPGLKGMDGKSTWKVYSKEMEEFTKVEDVPKRLQTTLRPSIFPPSPEEAEKFNLQYCQRILPHAQDTGGFFIALLEKTEEVVWVARSNSDSNRKKLETGATSTEKTEVNENSAEKSSTEVEMKSEVGGQTATESETKTDSGETSEIKTETQTDAGATSETKTETEVTEKKETNGKNVSETPQTIFDTEIPTIFDTEPQVLQKRKKKKVPTATLR